MMNQAIKGTWGDRVYDVIVAIVLVVVLLICLYPLYFVLIASVSDYVAVNNGEVLLYPVRFTLECYQRLAQERFIWTGYLNTFFYTVTGTLLDVSVTILAAYALSRKDLVGRKGIMGYFLFVMFFSGGLIPLYITVNRLGLHNTRWVMILLGTVNIYNLIVARTFFEQTISDELLDASRVDGCGNARFFVSVALPLSSAIVAVITLYYAVEHWNNYFNALIFISDYDIMPLQIIARDILIANQRVDFSSEIEDVVARQRYAELLKYGIVIVSSVPMLIAYPFVQKYFVKGVMIGAIKG